MSLRSSSRRTRPIAVALVAAAIGVSCGGLSPAGPPGPSDTPFGSNDTLRPPLESTLPSVAPPAEAAGHGTSRRELLVMAGRPGTMGLERVTEVGSRKPIPLPDPDVAWLSTSRDGGVLATTREGQAFVADPLVGSDPPRWRRLPTTERDLRALAGPLAFGSLSPDGRSAAFIAADFAAGGPFELVILPIPGDGRRTVVGDPRPSSRIVAPLVVRIQRSPEGAPPAWLGERVVLLARTSYDQVGSIIVDLAGGLTDGPAPRGRPGQAGSIGRVESIAGLTIAADGSRLAVESDSDGRIEIHPAEPWLAGGATRPVLVDVPPTADGSRSVAWLAMAPDGERLALVRTSDDGESIVVTVHEDATGWRQLRRVGLPIGADRAVVAWLP